MIKQVIFLVAIASIVYALQCNQGTSGNTKAQNCTTAKQCYKYVNSSTTLYGCDDTNAYCTGINGTCKVQNTTQGSLTTCCCSDKDKCNFGTSRFSLPALAVPILAMLYFR